MCFMYDNEGRNSGLVLSCDSKAINCSGSSFVCDSNTCMFSIRVWKVDSTSFSQIITKESKVQHTVSKYDIFQHGALFSSVSIIFHLIRPSTISLIIPESRKGDSFFLILVTVTSRTKACSSVKN